MNNISDFLGSGKPKRITEYTSGTGTYVPTVDMARCFVRIQAGGGSGGWYAGSASGIGGGGGACIELMVRIPIAGWSYTVGAGGAAPAVGQIGINGSQSVLGIYRAMQGFGGQSGTLGGAGGVINLSEGSVNATSVTVWEGNGFSGYSGGAGGNASASAKLVGYPFSVYSSSGVTPYSNNYAQAANPSGTLGGGDSYYGRGGVTQTAPAAGNYGAGGGGAATGSNAGGAGAGGFIEIWDFGA